MLDETADAETSADDSPTARAPRRRRSLWLTAGTLAVVLAIGGVSWWGLARADAQTRAADVVAQVSGALDRATDAHSAATAAETELSGLRDDVVAPVLSVAADSPDALSPEIAGELSGGSEDATAVLERAHELREPTTDFPTADDALADRMLWGQAEAVTAEAADEVARLGEVAADARDLRAELTELHAHTVNALARLGADTAARATQAHDRLEHAGDHRAALGDAANTLATAASDAAHAGNAQAWAPFVEQVRSFVEVLATAQATHDARVAEIEAEQRAEQERREAEQRRAAEAKRAPAPGGGGSGGGGAGGGGSGGGGSGGGGGDNWCPEVNWTGYIILVPC